MLNETLCNNNAKLFVIFMKMPTFRYSINIVVLIRDKKIHCIFARDQTQPETPRSNDDERRKKLFEKYNIRKGNET